MIFSPSVLTSLKERNRQKGTYGHRRSATEYHPEREAVLSDVVLDPQPML